MTPPILRDLPTDAFRVLNGMRHHLLVWEAPAGAPTLVLLHGWLDLAWSFAPLAEALRRRGAVRLVAVDLRGHGETEWVAPGGYYHFSDYVADVHALLASEPGPIHLLGHSMGSTVASLVAGAFPDRAQKLVLVEGLGPAFPSEPPPERMARWIHEVVDRRTRLPRPLAGVEEAAQKLRESNHRISRDFSFFLAERATRPLDGGRVWRFDPLHRTRSPQSFLIDEYKTFLGAITAPTLLVRGDESGFSVVMEDGRAEAIADRREVELAGAGHMVHHDAPEALADAIAGFLGLA